MASSFCFFKVGLENEFPQVSFEVTNVCNLKCKHCCNDSGVGRPVPQLDKKKMFELFDDLKSIGCKNIYLTGGEPTCHPFFSDILNYLHKHDISVTLATNGFSTEKYLDVIKKTISTSGVFISLDGIGETHDSFRGVKGSYENALKTIKLLSSNGVPVRVNTILWNGNQGQQEEVIKVVKNLGVNRISFQGLYETGRAKKNNIFLTEDEYKEAINTVHKLMEKYGDDSFRITIRRDEKVKKEDFCSGGIRILHIDYNGVFYPCSWVAKSPLEKKYSYQWEKTGDIHTCIEKVQEIQGYFEDQKKQGNFGCPAVTASESTGKDPLIKIYG